MNDEALKPSDSELENTERANPEPEVLEAEWDLNQVEVLFDELNRGADIRHVQVRTAAGTGSNDRATSLNDALTMLRGGEARAIQIRYAFQQQLWCDTLMVGDDKVRIIRTREPHQPD